jgi:hypothetical protein
MISLSSKAGEKLFVPAIVEAHLIVPTIAGKAWTHRLLDSATVMVREYSLSLSSVSAITLSTSTTILSYEFRDSCDV